MHHRQASLVFLRYGARFRVEQVIHTLTNVLSQTSKANFKNACPFKVSIIKGAGHGLNFQYTAPETYKTILDFFVQNGVGPAKSYRTVKRN